MQKYIVTLCTAISLSLSGASLAEHKPGQMEGHQHGSSAAAGSGQADINKHHDCAQCGMDRGKFDSSRMLVTYKDGSSVGVCSIHCVATELKKNRGKALKSIEVGDYNTKKLINAEKAFWVIGGDKSGVMTMTAKWAFARKDAAEAFIKKSGGKLATYKEALALAEKE